MILVIDVERTCNKCGHTGPLEEFTKSIRHKHGRRPICKPCWNSARVRYESPEQKRKWYIKWAYRITPKQYDDILATQDGVCAICCKLPKDRLHIDHDHTTGQVRGLLCQPCNLALGHLHDSVYNLQSAISYLNDSGY